MATHTESTRRRLATMAKNKQALAAHKAERKRSEDEEDEGVVGQRIASVDRDHMGQITGVTLKNGVSLGAAGWDDDPHLEVQRRSSP